MAETLSSPVLICGMHRSYTSVFTHWLHLCGLHVGSSFADASTENPTGYWEDLDFVRLSEQVLSTNGLDAMSHEFEPLVISEEQLKKADMLITAKSAGHNHWGWKDPRTCILYSVLWSEVVDEHFVIGLYRPFEEVVTSLMLRSLNDQIASSHYKSLINKFDFLSRKIRTPSIRKLALESALHDHFLKVWIAYNRSLVSILATVGTSNSILVQADNFKDKELANFINKKWNIPLSHVPLARVWRPRRKSGPVNYHFDSELVQNAQDIDRQMKGLLQQSRDKIRLVNG